MLKRVFDIKFCMIAIVFFSLVMIIIAVLIRLTSKGPIFFWSKRIGKNNKIFKMPKFRTMIENTPEMASHKMIHPENYLTPIGGFLRRSSLDELPQLLSILKGDMSLVGPRPALFNQKDLIELRNKKDLHLLLPGITGWAQVNGRDDLDISKKVFLDHEYFKRRSIWFDMKILWLTFLKVLNKDGISH